MTEENFKIILEKVQTSNAEERLDNLRKLRLLVTQIDLEKYFSEESGLFEEYFKVLFPLLEENQQNELTRRITWQIFCNSCVNHANLTNETIQKLTPSFILEKLSKEVLKTQNVICALINLNIEPFARADTNIDTFKVILGLCQNDCDFAIVAILAMLKYEEVLDKIDDFLNTDELIEIYELCQDALENEKISEKTLLFLVKSLKKKNNALLNTYFKDLVCPIETSKLLLIVCKASSTEKWQKLLQNDKSLLIETIFLLKMMHDTEKSNGSLHQNPDNKTVQDSPINGFKCNMVRLLGNLTYRNKANQDEMRECNGIEMLLDCSPLDIRNPLITQWVVVATRNLCENNPENQAVIAQLDKKGVMDKEALRKVGIDIHDF